MQNWCSWWQRGVKLQAAAEAGTAQVPAVGGSCTGASAVEPRRYPEDIVLRHSLTPDSLVPPHILQAAYLMNSFSV